MLCRHTFTALSEQQANIRHKSVQGRLTVVRDSFQLLWVSLKYQNRSHLQSQTAHFFKPTELFSVSYSHSFLLYFYFLLGFILYGVHTHTRDSSMNDKHTEQARLMRLKLHVMDVINYWIECKKNSFTNCNLFIWNMIYIYMQDIVTKLLSQ
jgi:hypothetical protein